MEWNEDNFDVTQNGYTRWCYENRKFAFLSDYVRLAVLVAEHGGLYFDTDVELLRSPDFLLDPRRFSALKPGNMWQAAWDLARRRMGA